MSAPAKKAQIPTASLYVLALRQAVRDGQMSSVATVDLGELSLEIRAGTDSLWAFVRRAGAGGLAVRAAYWPGRSNGRSSARAAVKSLGWNSPARSANMWWYFARAA
jgi:hypothetical protein